MTVATLAEIRARYASLESTVSTPPPPSTPSPLTRYLDALRPPAPRADRPPLAALTAVERVRHLIATYRALGYVGDADTLADALGAMPDHTHFYDAWKAAACPSTFEDAA